MEVPAWRGMGLGSVVSSGVRAGARAHRRERASFLRGLPDFELNDEVFQALDDVSGATPLMHAQVQSDPQKAWHPMLWARQQGRGRVVYDALGHDPGSIAHPVHAQILTRAALWAAGAGPSEIRA